MYVPGDDNRKLRKASQLNVDCIALDCEDGVAISRKQVARESIRAFFDSELNVPTYDCIDKRRTEWSVRLNAVDSELCEEDLKVIVSGKRVPETLLLPKCESPADLKVVRNIQISNMSSSYVGSFQNGCRDIRTHSHWPIVSI